MCHREVNNFGKLPSYKTMRKIQEEYEENMRQRGQRELENRARISAERANSVVKNFVAFLKPELLSINANFRRCYPTKVDFSELTNIDYKYLFECYLEQKQEYSRREEHYIRIGGGDHLNRIRAMFEIDDIDALKGLTGLYNVEADFCESKINFLENKQKFKENETEFKRTQAYFDETQVRVKQIIDEKGENEDLFDVSEIELNELKSLCQESLTQFYEIKEQFRELKEHFQEFKGKCEKSELKFQRGIYQKFSPRVSHYASKASRLVLSVEMCIALADCYILSCQIDIGRLEKKIQMKGCHQESPRLVGSECASEVSSSEGRDSAVDFELLPIEAEFLEHKADYLEREAEYIEEATQFKERNREYNDLFFQFKIQLWGGKQIWGEKQNAAWKDMLSGFQAFFHNCQSKFFEHQAYFSQCKAYFQDVYTKLPKKEAYSPGRDWIHLKEDIKSHERDVERCIEESELALAKIQQVREVVIDPELVALEAEFLEHKAEYQERQVKYTEEEAQFKEKSTEFLAAFHQFYMELGSTQEAVLDGFKDKLSGLKAYFQESQTTSLEHQAYFSEREAYFQGIHVKLSQKKAHSLGVEVLRLKAAIRGRKSDMDDCIQGSKSALEKIQRMEEIIQSEIGERVNEAIIASERGALEAEFLENKAEYLERKAKYAEEKSQFKEKSTEFLEISQQFYVKLGSKQETVLNEFKDKLSGLKAYFQESQTRLLEQQAYFSEREAYFQGIHTQLSQTKAYSLSFEAIRLKEGVGRRKQSVDERVENSESALMEIQEIERIIESRFIRDEVSVLAGGLLSMNALDSNDDQESIVHLEQSIPEAEVFSSFQDRIGTPLDNAESTSAERAEVCRVSSGENQELIITTESVALEAEFLDNKATYLEREAEYIEGKAQLKEKIDEFDAVYRPLNTNSGREMPEAVLNELKVRMNEYKAYFQESQTKLLEQQAYFSERSAYFRETYYRAYRSSRTGGVCFLEGGGLYNRAEQIKYAVNRYLINIGFALENIQKAERVIDSSLIRLLKEAVTTNKWMTIEREFLDNKAAYLEREAEYIEGEAQLREKIDEFIALYRPFYINSGRGTPEAVLNGLKVKMNEYKAYFQESQTRLLEQQAYFSKLDAYFEETFYRSLRSSRTERVCLQEGYGLHNRAEEYKHAVNGYRINIGFILENIPKAERVIESSLVRLLEETVATNQWMTIEREFLDNKAAYLEREAEYIEGEAQLREKIGEFNAVYSPFYINSGRGTPEAVLNGLKVKMNEYKAYFQESQTRLLEQQSYFSEREAYFRETYNRACRSSRTGGVCKQEGGGLQNSAQEHKLAVNRYLINIGYILENVQKAERIIESRLIRLGENRPRLVSQQDNPGFALAESTEGSAEAEPCDGIAALRVPALVALQREFDENSRKHAKMQCEYEEASAQYKERNGELRQMCIRFNKKLDLREEGVRDALMDNLSGYEEYFQEIKTQLLDYQTHLSRSKVYFHDIQARFSQEGDDVYACQGRRLERSVELCERSTALWINDVEMNVRKLLDFKRKVQAYAESLRQTAEPARKQALVSTLPGNQTPRVELPLVGEVSPVSFSPIQASLALEPYGKEVRRKWTHVPEDVGHGLPNVVDQPPTDEVLQGPGIGADSLEQDVVLKVAHENFFLFCIQKIHEILSRIIHCLCSSYPVVLYQKVEFIQLQRTPSL